ncbi:hypothetical protein NDU88_002164 [Pleurodeles waltl]|uniref:Uncharacterized protein n=1 Tax=Pleurodeles waltl TaxID=8319 RepID=A0AAV7R971_PLEWA|nr:hypothetical protein NDU88_002164 [Pleurodeles waltl]
MSRATLRIDGGSGNASSSTADFSGVPRRQWYQEVVKKGTTPHDHQLARADTTSLIGTLQRRQVQSKQPEPRLSPSPSDSGCIDCYFHAPNTLAVYKALWWRVRVDHMDQEKQRSPHTEILKTPVAGKERSPWADEEACDR